MNTAQRKGNAVNIINRKVQKKMNSSTPDIHTTIIPYGYIEVKETALSRRTKFL